MNYYLDTEFLESQGKLQLISIGVENDKGDTYYAVSSEFKDEDCNDWVKANVLPELKDDPRWPLSKIKEDLLAFIINTEEDRPIFWGYYADYDWILFCWIFGAMIDLPKGYPMYCRDLKQELDLIQLPEKLKPSQIKEHHALFDAGWNKRLHKQLMVHEMQVAESTKIRQCDLIEAELLSCIKSYEVGYNAKNKTHIELNLKLVEGLKVVTPDDNGGIRKDATGRRNLPKREQFISKNILTLQIKHLDTGLGYIAATKEFKFRNADEKADIDYWKTTLYREMMYDIVGASVAYCQMKEQHKRNLETNRYN